MTHRRFIALALLGWLAGVTGCRHVSPWERGSLADPTMAADGDPLAKMYADQLPRFLALKGKLDPDGVLRNAFFERVFEAPAAHLPRAQTGQSLASVW